MSAGSPPLASLDGWLRRPFTGGGSTYDCFERGEGPGVVLIPEVPGITPEVLGLAEHLVSEGFTVAIPSPFGTPGRAATPGYTLRTIARLCVSAEMRAFAAGAHRPITDFLRALAADLASRTPGRGVGVIGMCFTGGFALATAVDDSVLASVLAEPAVPFPISPRRRADAGASEPEIARVIYPGRADHPQADIVARQMSGGSTLICLDLKGGKKAAFALQNALDIVLISNNLGDAKSLITHPATTTHKNLAEEARAELGINPGTVRLSVGLEDVDDLIADIDQALSKVG